MKRFNILFALTITILSFSLTGCSNVDDDLTLYGKINGIVYDFNTEERIPNATITLSPSGISVQTDNDGYYQFDRLDIQQYTLLVQKAGYQPNRKSVMIIRGETQQVNFQLTAIPYN